MKNIEEFMNDGINKKEARRRQIQYLNIKNILGINKFDFWIYLAFFILSISTIIPYAFCQGVAPTILMSFGCSMFGAVLLAYFLALRLERARIHNESLKHNKMLYDIYGLVYSICDTQNPSINSNRIDNSLLPFLKGREKHDEKVFVELTDVLNEYIFIYGEYIEEGFFKKICDLNSQISEFSNNMVRIDSINDVSALYTFLIVGIPEWLEKNMDENFIKDHYIG